MNKPVSRPDLEQLYQQRKRAIQPPTVSLPHNRQAKLTKKTWLGLSLAGGVTSIAVFALIVQLQQPQLDANDLPVVQKNHEVTLAQPEAEITIPQVIKVTRPKLPEKPATPSQPERAVSEMKALTVIKPEITLQTPNNSGQPEQAMPSMTVNMPKVIQQVLPDYPKEAASKKLSGKVTLSYRITASGETDNVELIEQHGDRAFVRSARQAVKKWQFNQDNTRAAQTRYQVTFEFSPDDD